MNVSPLNPGNPSLAPAPQVAPSSVQVGAPLPQDLVVDGREPAPESLGREAREAILGAGTQTGGLRARFATEPVLTEHLAGWKARVSGPSNALAWPVAPLDPGGTNYLVTPVEQGAGGAFLPPLVVDPQRGPVRAPDLEPVGNSMSFRPVGSTDTDRVYLVASGTTHLPILDGSLSPVKDLDLQTLHPQVAGVTRCFAGRQAAYICTNGGQDSTWRLSALDPKDGSCHWSWDLGPSRIVSDLVEGPDGRLVVVVDNLDLDTQQLVTFSDQGHPASSLALPFRARRLLLDGDRVFVQGPQALYRIDMGPQGFLSPDLPATATPTWETPGGFEAPQFSPDKKALVAADTMSGFYRCHVLRSIDPENGQILWERKSLGERYVNHRVLDDRICLVSTVQDQGKSGVRMTQLDFQGNVLWQASIPGEFDEYDTASRNTITARGEFILGGNDGCLRFVRPRRAEDTEDSLRAGLDLTDKVVRETVEAVRQAQDQPKPQPQSPGIQDGAQEIVIGGVRLAKRMV